MRSGAFARLNQSAGIEFDNLAPHLGLFIVDLGRRGRPADMLEPAVLLDNGKRGGRGASANAH